MSSICSGESLPKPGRTHAKCLEESEDIAQVKEWIEGFVARQPEQANAHLVMGLFLAQSGQSEQSIAAYKESISTRATIRPSPLFSRTDP